MGPRSDLDSPQIPHFQVQALHLAQAEFREPHAGAGSQPRNRRMLPSGPFRAKDGRRPARAKGMTMKTAHTEGGFQEAVLYHKGDPKKSDYLEVCETSRSFIEGENGLPALKQHQRKSGKLGDGPLEDDKQQLLYFARDLVADLLPRGTPKTGQ